MNETQIQSFRKQLMDTLDALDRGDARGAAGQRTVELDQQAVGRLSRMDALQNQAMAKATGARRAAQRTRIQAAFSRMDEGEFGYCEDCGEDIPSGRLDLDPCATKCVSCAIG
ncbi:TraR/DksA family transcriptional regulator [Aliiroseovarius sp. S1339]|uniref:TraR/DksA family transcriptional regulator n=1 Tax=Aliiroseovarius sp. S1339 TaxID=2936990 RepID=UPI0020BFC035|nr:TraR/DksA family transcriptional regulator [Aliiroseovarius sp. S1339]MCK8462564.1 TraR/DksA family transcriptional regulator [Aliiroseovarius sp. S1339]